MMTAVDAQHIRQLFLERQPSYRLSEAARILSMTRGRLEREARANQEDVYRTNGRWRFTWQQVAGLAFRRWTLVEIHDALGCDAAEILPPLLALRSITVRLPEYLLRAIQHEATSLDTTIDNWLQHELVEFAGRVVERMERLAPGYRSACLYPGGESAHQVLSRARSSQNFQ